MRLQVPNPTNSRAALTGSRPGGRLMGGLGLRVRLGAAMRRAPAASRKLLPCALTAILLAVSACSGGSGGAPLPSSGQPPPQPEPPGVGGFTPDREIVVAFPALLAGGLPDEEREARAEAGRVSAMHGRGGTGRGEIVGTIESGANPEHPDLAGQFAHVCAMGECDDGRPELDRRDPSPSLDTHGHGTSVNGIVAARRNGTGVYGVAYEARIASYGNTHTVVYPWGNICGGADCPPRVADREDQWGPVFDEQIARGVDWMNSLGVRAVNNSWLRTWSWARERGVTAATIREIMPKSLPAFERYVGAGGVAVWGAGNGRSFHPSEEAVLPLYFPDLEKGWLAVVGVDPDGHISRGSWRCGVAAEWCVAAPMLLVTTDRNGRWSVAGGTSIAAPYVTASLAALKSMFPNLSYQQVRARILATADRAGRYADAATYGRGRLDLDAASRPVGGTNFVLGAVDTGAVASTAGAYVSLPEGAVERYLAGRTTLVLDGFQRAPFEVALDAFAAARRPYLSMDDLAFATRDRRREEGEGYTSFAASGGGTLAQGLSAGRWFVGTGRGPEVARSLAALAGIPLAAGDYRMSREAAGVALGFAGEAGRWRAVMASGGTAPGEAGFGTSGWSPETVLAASFAPHGGRDTFGVSLAPDLGRPMGWEGSGALALEGGGAALGWRRNVAERDAVRLKVTGRLAHLAVRDGPLLRFGDALIATAGVEASVALHPSVTLRARFGTERPVSGASGWLRMATSVDGDGRIAYDHVAIDGRHLLTFDRAALGLGIAAGSDASIGLGLAAVRDGFGHTETLAWLRMEARF